MNEWIDVSKQKPSESEEYIVLCGQAVTCGWYLMDDDEWITNEDQLLENVSHWMLLPDPPQASL